MNRITFRWLLSVGILGLLGFTSCSPRLRPRHKTVEPADTLAVPRPDTLKKTPGNFPPIKLMYGVPPARYEVLDFPEKEKEQ